MSDLLDFVIDTHGGMKLWSTGTAVRATVDGYGSLLAGRGQAALLGSAEVVARLDRQHLTARSRQSALEIEYDNDRNQVRVTSHQGELIEVLDDPRRSMLGLDENASWTTAQAGYFIGYAIWSYLLEPYILTLPGIQLRELESHVELGETWRRLEVTFPPTLATHSESYIYHFDAETGLQRRIDYAPAVNRSPLASHYTFEHRFYDGIPVPSARRVLRRTNNGQPNYQLAGIMLDISDFRIT